MTAMSNFLEAELADHVLGNAAYTAPATVYLALYTVAPTDAGGGTEVSGNGYTRLAVTNNATNWPAGNPKSNGVELAFAAASGGNWGTIVAVGVFDAATSGNLLFHGSLTTNQVVNDGSVAKFAASALTFTFD